MGSAASKKRIATPPLPKQASGAGPGFGVSSAGPSPAPASPPPANGAEQQRLPPGSTPYEHSPAPLPPDESERMDFLCSLNVLDTAPEKRFDDLTKLCCMIFKVPIALVSLVDKERQWFKSVQGLPVTQTDRQVSFCAWTLLPEHPEVLVVESALEDVRFQQNGLVQGFPHIRFYAGAPLVAANGRRLGSLCIIDTKPRKFDADSCVMLANFGEMVMREIEKEKMLELQKAQSAQLSKENHQLLRAMDCFNEGILLCDAGPSEWPILFVNEAWERMTGVTKDEGTERGFWEIFELPAGQEDRMREVYEAAIEARKGFEITVSMQQAVTPILDMAALQGAAPMAGGPHRDSAGAEVGGRRWYTLTFRCASNDQLDSFMPLVGVPPILADHADDADPPLYYFCTLQGAAPPSSAGGRLTSAMPTGTAASSALATSTSGTRLPAAVLEKKLDPFQDVQLGPLLGKGAFGRVYRGQWNGATVAVKVLEHAAQANGEGILEALVSGSLSHPNVVQTYKHCAREMSFSHMEDDDGNKMMETWMVMEFCNKGSLSDAVDRGWLRRKHSLFEPDFGAILKSAGEVAAAMTYLHSRGILHGDLTGNNVLLGVSETDERKWSAKVADFGLSRVLSQGADRIQTKTYGTVTHMPPELLVDGVMSKAADVFAFGMLLYEMVMGQRPYAGMSHGQIVHAITANRPPQLGSICPTPMRKFVLRCLSPRPEERPPFPEVLEALTELESELVG